MPETCIARVELDTLGRHIHTGALTLELARIRRFRRLLLLVGRSVMTALTFARNLRIVGRANRTGHASERMMVAASKQSMEKQERGHQAGK